VLRSLIHAGAALLAALLLIATGCARKTAVRVSPPPPAPAVVGSIESGIASWYGAPYHGRRTSSGEVYDMEQLTAAHRTLPFDTLVEVTDLDNGKRVEVRITDRGPFVDGRIIDLSRAAAREIDMLGPGTARVTLKVIATSAPAPVLAPTAAPAPAPAPAEKAPPEIEPPAPRYAVQAGAFFDRERAESFRSSLAANYPDTRLVEAAPVWRVLVGRQMTLDAANKLAAQVRDASGEALVVRDR
jgi:rare lipoprotein A